MTDDARLEHVEGLEWGEAVAFHPESSISGDRAVILRTSKGALMGAVDGLGHGEEAAIAGDAACDVLRNHPDASIPRLFERCHEALLRTRGVVMSLISLEFDGDRLTWAGVGNVAGVIIHASEGERPERVHLPARGGIVGATLPPVTVRMEPVHPGDLILLATDGVSQGFAEGIPLRGPPQGLAEYVCRHHCKRTDDALVLVARYLGAP